MEVSYCIFGFRAISRRDLLTLSLLGDSPRDNLRAWFESSRERQLTLNEIIWAGLATKKSGSTITHLHTWQQDGRHNRFPFKFPWSIYPILYNLYKDFCPLIGCIAFIILTIYRIRWQNILLHSVWLGKSTKIIYYYTHHYIYTRVFSISNTIFGRLL